MLVRKISIGNWNKRDGYIYNINILSLLTTCNYHCVIRLIYRSLSEYTVGNY